MPRAIRQLPVTQVLLSLRRMAEAEAQARLRLARHELELAKVAEQKAATARQRASERLELLQQRVLATPVATAQQLDELADTMQANRQALTLAQAEEAARSLRKSELRHEIEELQRHLRLCVARREAAELHESAERREQRRQRDRRERAIEEDARDRVLSATRPGTRS